MTKGIGLNISLLLMLFLIQFHSSAQLPIIKTTVDKNKILIGEQIDYSVQVIMPNDKYRLTWLRVPQDFGAFVLASNGKIDTTYTTGKLSFKQNLRITSFDSGRQIIPPLPFEFETFNGDSLFRLMTDSIVVSVAYSPADSVLPFHDIKPILIVQEERPWWFWPAIILGILVAASLITYLVIRSKRKKKNKRIFHSELSDFDEAIKLLEDLKNEKLPDKGEFKLYFVRLTDIFKRYISRKSNTNLMHLTGDEMIANFSLTEPDKGLLKDFASAVKMADAAKFAKYAPAVLQSEESLDHIEKAIRQIHLKEEEQKKEEGRHDS